MSVTGIICEYNPLHLGHKKQLNAIRAADPTGAVVCLMSGNFVQRGAPAIFDKQLRAKAAVHSGADLVLELPVTTALCSAEGFAAGGVDILSRFCDRLCFGAENADETLLTGLAKALLSKDFSDALKTELEKGLSFPAARQSALEVIGLDASPLSLPNNILAVEYCKAILAQKSGLKPYVIPRQGGYHDQVPDPENPSATAIRRLIETGKQWQQYVPDAELFENATIHSLHCGERAILARLRTMTDAEFEALPFGSEGLWRKLMHASRQASSLEDILLAVKSKRYTRTRLDRMVMCAFLGITDAMLSSPPPYVRILAFNDKGRQILNQIKQNAFLVNIGQRVDDTYQLLEARCGTLYGLFAQDTTESADAEDHRRVQYIANSAL